VDGADLDGVAREVVVEPVDQARDRDEPSRERVRRRAEVDDSRGENAEPVRAQLLGQQIDPAHDQRLSGFEDALERVAQARIFARRRARRRSRAAR